MAVAGCFILLQVQKQSFIMGVWYSSKVRITGIDINNVNDLHTLLETGNSMVKNLDNSE